MEKKRRAGPGSRIPGTNSSEGCRLHRGPRRGPGSMGRRQTSDSSGSVGRDPNSSRRYCEKNGSNKMKRIKHNDLTHYFIREHSTLPAAYLASCNKFFKSLKCRQAPASCHPDGWPAGRGRVGPKATSSQKIKVDKLTSC